MHIVFVIAELAPYAQVGGLGAVAKDLPPALVRAGLEVTVVIPRHESLRKIGSRSVTDLTTPAGTAHAWSGEIDDVRLVTIDVDGLFGDGPVYQSNDLERFGRFSVAVPSVVAALELRPDLYHVHDWHTALTAVAVDDTPTILTIHNLAHQGWFQMDDPWGLADLVVRDGWAGMLASGIAHADRVTTVSPTYAAEIQTPELGMGLDALLSTRGVTGIVNGIDTDEWNPASDPHLAAPYDAAHLEGKETNRTALLDAFGLADTGGLIAAVVSRFDHQKGLDLIPGAIEPHLNRMMMVALGTGDQDLENRYASLAETHPGEVAYRAEFDVGLSHLMEAGADVFLMPSRFEPCGLNQMYSMRYGTIPIVHRTGGLADTVTPWNADTGQGTGFIFDSLTADGLSQAMAAALAVSEDDQAWRQLIRNAMARDSSWDASAREYVQLYTQVVE